MKRCDILVVLDTNVIIDYLIGKEDAVREVNSYRKNDLSTTFVNEYELLKNTSRKIMEDAIQKDIPAGNHHPSGMVYLSAGDS